MNQTLPEGRYLDEFHHTGFLFNNKRCLSAFAGTNNTSLRRHWYTGGGLGFHAHFIRYPDHDLSIVAFGNVSTAKAWDDMARTLPKVADTLKTTNERFNGMIFTFSRDASANLTGFGLKFDRVRDLRFERVALP